jgi:glycosyltransferase involved in cell wall biosynthesis
MNQPRLTVVIPVFERDAELRRALVSLKDQSFRDFECLIIDDASSISPEPIITELADSRFRYLRNVRNGGPYNARTLGYRHMQGEFLLQLDSDWEAFPWALSQAVRYLDEYPQVDAVAGMHLRHHDSSLFVRVTEGKKIVTPETYQKGRLAPDCIGAVRRTVVEEWLKKRDDYFAMEFHQWFTFSMQHSQLYVDEPWTRYHTDSGNRVSTGSRERRLDDYMKFIEEHDALLRSVDAPFLSDLLFNMWFNLYRAGRESERKRLEPYLKLKGVPVFRMLAQKIGQKLASLVKGRCESSSPVFYI